MQKSLFNTDTNFFLKKDNGINIISLFDGMSCGQQALDKLNINIANYYASEIDKYAMQVTRYNYPKTKFVGSVTDISIRQINNKEIILNEQYIIDIERTILIGGSPCQGFSFVGKMKGASTTCNIEIITLSDYVRLKNDGFQFNG